MFLYHGTRGSLGEKILTSGFLDINAPKVYNEQNCNHPTTACTISLTNDLLNAINYGNKAGCGISKTDSHIYVFKLDVHPDILSPDEDEFKIFNQHNAQTNLKSLTVQQSLDMNKSVWAKQNILLTKYNSNKFKISNGTTISWYE